MDTLTPATIEARYQDALLRYLAQPEESTLVRGYELGRIALGEGVGLLEMVTIHSRVIAAALSSTSTERNRERVMAAQVEFLVEALSPFEMAHRAFRDANKILRRLNDMLEGQAKRIAYSLHSEAGQLLASVHLALADASRDVSTENAVHLVTVRSLLVEMESRLRNLSHELRPPVLDDLGLGSALELLAESVSKRWGLPVTVTVSIESDLPATVENTIYRVAQEAVANTAKHAEATRVDIDLRQTDRRLVCSIRDDGVGFDSTAGFRKRRPGLGLTEIRERIAALGGIVRLGMNRDRGTDLTIEIPLDV